MNMLSFTSQVILSPLSSYKSGEVVVDNLDNGTLVIPVAPSDLMFYEDSDGQTIKLMNYGELPVGMNKKLATWGITSFFPYLDENKFRYPFLDKNTTLRDPYEYCKVLLEWKKSQTPLVFMFKTWGNYYNCQIKSFKYGRNDSSGNVYYELQFQEYKKYTRFNESAASTDYSADVYYPATGENILQIAKKIYGDSSYYTKIMKLNNMSNPEITQGQAYKIR